MSTADGTPAVGPSTGPPAPDPATLSAGVEVLAAGGVVWQPGGIDGEPEVLVVHRPRYDDWTLPKGKLEPGETLSLCALREVGEETGLDVELGPFVADVTYRDHRGRRKGVRYWSMAAVGGGFVPNDEVDRVRWGSLADVRRALTHDVDREVLDRFAALNRRV